MKIAAVFFGSCLKEFHSVWNCLFNIITFCLKDVGAICFVVSGSARVAHFTRLCLKAVTEPNSAEPTKLTEWSLFIPIDYRYVIFFITCWERADLLALVCGVFCEFVTFPLVSWVRCGTLLYRFLIFAPLLTFFISL